MQLHVNVFTYIYIYRESWQGICDFWYSYLVHGEVSVVEVAGASLKANFSHAVVNQKKIPQLQTTQSLKNHHQTVHLQISNNTAAAAYEYHLHFSVVGQDPSRFRRWYTAG